MQTLRLNGKNYELQSITGKVLGSSKNMETKVSGGGGGGYTSRGSGYTAPVRVTSSTTIHDQFFLMDKDNIEHAYQLSDFNLACRDGHVLTVISAADKNSRYHLSVINHSIDKTYFDKIAINQISTPNKIIFSIGFIISLLLAFKFSGGGLGLIAIFALVGIVVYYFVTLNSNIKAVKEAVNSKELSSTTLIQSFN